MLFCAHCSQAEAEKVLNQITKRTNRGLCKLTKNASSSNVIDLAQDLSSSEDEKFVFSVICSSIVCGVIPFQFSVVLLIHNT